MTTTERVRAWRLANPDKVKAYAKKAYEKDREAHKARTRASALKNPAVYLLRAARYRAQQRGIPFELEAGDIVVPTHCPILGLELKTSTGRSSDASPSLDRVRPELGYVKGNVEVISLRANRIKADATAEEIIRVGRWLESRLKS